MLSIQKFGLNFWRTDVWDPVAGQFGALPFIWGTLYSSILALAIATPIALGIAVFISELSPGLAQAAAGVSDGAPGGDSVDCLRPLGHLRAGASGSSARSLDAVVAPPVPVVQRTSARRRDAGGRRHSRRHGDPLHLVGGARSAEGRPRRAARRGVRARRDALRGDPRGALLRAHGHHRRRDARLRPRPGRDDGGDDGDREQRRRSRRRCSRRSTRWPPCSRTSSPKPTPSCI